jgi:uncharacterized protein YaaN involved in tellurite resistance
MQLIKLNSSKTSIDIDILTSEIKQKEDEITNLNKNINFLIKKRWEANNNLKKQIKKII